MNLSSKKSKSSRDLYGVLASIGYNGQFAMENHGRYRPLYHVRKRKEANGLKPNREVDLTSEAAKKVIADQYTVTFLSEKGFGSVVDFKKDNKSDMFQIGRSTEALVDYIVVDTYPGPKDNINELLSHSTISRFACRIIADRPAPHKCRIYAAAFDASKRIFLGESAPQWSNGKRTSDGLTTNGVLLCHPKGEWGVDMHAGSWREVSVSGEMFGLRSARSARQRGKTTDCSNTLQDGTLVDLCGVVLLWRTPEGISKAPSLDELNLKKDMINALKAQCPVGLGTLRFPSSNNKQKNSSATPYLYTNCGHVHGYHVWGARPTITSVEDVRFPDKRHCPFCNEYGHYVELNMAMEPLYYVDNGPATHAFVPCGHMTTEATARYWSQVLLPHGKDKFHTACPFCAEPLRGPKGYVKLIFQTLGEPTSKKEIFL